MIYTSYKKLILRSGFKSGFWNPLLWYCGTSYVNAILKSDRKKTISVCRKVCFINRKYGLFLIAYYLVLKGFFRKSSFFLEKIINVHEAPARIYFLLISNYIQSRQKERGIVLIKKMIEESKSKKTWLIWANAIETKDEYTEIKSYWEKYIKNGRISQYDNAIRDYIITAALRSGSYQDAVAISQQSWSYLKKDQLIVPKTKQNIKFHIKDAGFALNQLREIFHIQEIEFFLISGTLLGCIREHSILGHDKDIDVGIWEINKFDNIYKLLSRSGKFEILPIRSFEVIRVRHINGICIDIFFHHREKNDYWHGGVKCKWHNTPFELKEVYFLGNTFKIPKNYILYLEENYGTEWVVPNPVFDSSIDTPNIEITNKYEMIAYCYKKIILNYANSKNIHYSMIEQKYKNILQQYKL